MNFHSLNPPDKHCLKRFILAVDLIILHSKDHITKCYMTTWHQNCMCIPWISGYWQATLSLLPRTVQNLLSSDHDDSIQLVAGIEIQSSEHKWVKVQFYKQHALLSDLWSLAIKASICEYHNPNKLVPCIDQQYYEFNISHFYHINGSYFCSREFFAYMATKWIVLFNIWGSTHIFNS